MPRIEFIRDGRAPLPRSDVTSKIMSANKAKNTTPELIMRKALREEGLLGYRLHWKKVPGRPDIVYPRKKIAIFIHGCFWHRCPLCNPDLPKSHAAFWSKKFENNKKRDEIKVKTLKSIGWKVFVFWECEIKKNPKSYIKKIKDSLNGA